MSYNYRNSYTLSNMMGEPMPEPPSGTNGRIYIVRPGDTMYRIAVRYNTGLQILVDSNPQISDPSRIMIGQRICIPCTDTAQPHIYQDSPACS
ncbi:LysM peptidoglycan-binding domain-containing protein [Alkaliphilus sp. B6464]|uniref:LysM peptidoglycan-binding domain-containing protein n=1 Tax=Alkaliphilus sp. B6464 TaxID=2731219 RepID=UPI001BA5AFB5|nr:LysM peptidoglycan-binding domain-containing protein [Alkaliphilus sp. B6464]QUH18518.1 LysM peptidoglycan-binding domain-containing protein [Alkaliphilus sp. B6464]